MNCLLCNEPSDSRYWSSNEIGLCAVHTEKLQDAMILGIKEIVDFFAEESPVYKIRKLLNTMQRDTKFLKKYEEMIESRNMVRHQFTNPPGLHWLEWGFDDEKY